MDTSRTRVLALAGKSSALDVDDRTHIRPGAAAIGAVLHGAMGLVEGHNRDTLHAPWSTSLIPPVRLETSTPRFACVVSRLA